MWADIERSRSTFRRSYEDPFGPESAYHRIVERSRNAHWVLSMCTMADFHPDGLSEAVVEQTFAESEREGPLRGRGAVQSVDHFRNLPKEEQVVHRRAAQKVVRAVAASLLDSDGTRGEGEARRQVAPAFAPVTRPHSERVVNGTLAPNGNDTRNRIPNGHTRPVEPTTMANSRSSNGRATVSTSPSSNGHSTMPNGTSANGHANHHQSSKPNGTGTPAPQPNDRSTPTPTTAAVAELSALLELSSEEVSQAKAEALKMKNDNAILRQHLDNLTDQFAAEKRKCDSLLAEKEAVAVDLARATDRLKELTEHADDMEKQRDRALQDVGVLGNAKERAEHNFEHALRDVSRLESTNSDLATELENAQSANSALAKELETFKAQLIAAEAQRDAGTQALMEAQRKHEISDCLRCLRRHIQDCTCCSHGGHVAPSATAGEAATALTPETRTPTGTLHLNLPKPRSPRSSGRSRKWMRSMGLVKAHFRKGPDGQYRPRTPRKKHRRMESSVSTSSEWTDTDVSTVYDEAGPSTAALTSASNASTASHTPMAFSATELRAEDARDLNTDRTPVNLPYTAPLANGNLPSATSLINPSSAPCLPPPAPHAPQLSKSTKRKRPEDVFGTVKNTGSVSSNDASPPETVQLDLRIGRQRPQLPRFTPPRLRPGNGELLQSGHTAEQYRMPGDPNGSVEVGAAPPPGVPSLNVIEASLEASGSGLVVATDAGASGDEVST